MESADPSGVLRRVRASSGFPYPTLPRSDTKFLFPHAWGEKPVAWGEKPAAWGEKPAPWGEKPVDPLPWGEKPGFSPLLGGKTRGPLPWGEKPDPHYSTST